MKKAWKNVHLNVEMKIFKTKVHLQLNSTKNSMIFENLAKY